MWNEMVKDEEISFNGEESAHPGMMHHFKWVVNTVNIPFLENVIIETRLQSE